MSKHFLDVSLEDDCMCNGCLLLEERETTSEYKWGCLLHRQEKMDVEKCDLTQGYSQLPYWRSDTYRSDACPLDKAVSYDRLKNEINSYQKALEKFTKDSCKMLTNLTDCLDCGHENGLFINE